MFYSHTFLARKGPLGTVWCAAHLQHRIKKSQYVATNIPSTVERIIDSEVPIALRMSAHLLLGVVRIYSKQVDYLREDCNVVLSTVNRVFTAAAAAAAVNLPEDANHATFHSITMPQRFELDAMVLDDYSNDWGDDVHLGNQEDITMTEQIPTGRDPYVAITWDENDLRSSPITEDPMEIDEESNPSVEIARPVTHNTDTPSLPDRFEPQSDNVINKDENIASSAAIGANFDEINSPSSPNPQEKDSSGHIDSPIIPDGCNNEKNIASSSPKPIEQGSSGHIDTPIIHAHHPSPENKDKPSTTPQGTPSVEIATIRPNVAQTDNDLVDSSVAKSVEIFRDGRKPPATVLPNVAEPDNDLVEQVNKDIASSVAEVAEVTVPSSDNPREPDSSGHVNSPNFSPPQADRSIEIELQASPPVAQPNVRKRKTKHSSFDAITVLSNNHMKNALEDTQDLLRVRTKPTSLEVWRVNKRLRKNDAFFEPFLTGTCEELQDIYKEDFISSKPHLIIPEPENQETNTAVNQEMDAAVNQETNTAVNQEMDAAVNQETDAAVNQEMDAVNQDTDVAVNQETNAENLETNAGKDPASCEVMREYNKIGSERSRTPSPSHYVGSESSIGKSNSTPETGNVEIPEVGETHPSSEIGGRSTATGISGSAEIETPSTIGGRDGMDFEYSYLSDIPESAGDLSFLEQEDNSPAVSQGTPQLVSCSTNKGSSGAFSGSTNKGTSGVFSGSTNKGTSGLGTLSSRTRAVAQYLKNQSFVSPIAENNSEQTGDELSLNKILEGKSRKVCARMFYEALVLKSLDRIDVHQEEPYDDITLKVIF